jgi:ABC-type transport system involved in multi-copper enzyme maturation permease subunit
VNLLASELLKVRTIRTPYVLLAVSSALSAIAAAAFVGSGALDFGEDDRALSLGQAASFGNTFTAVIGILIVTNEYRHGTIMTTFLAAPRRLRVLAAKLTASALVGLVFALLAVTVTLLVALPWLSARGDALSVDGQLLEAVGRVLVSFVLTAVIAAAVGAIIQSQVGALVGWFVWLLVVESLIGVLSGLLFTEVGEPDPISKFLPGSSLGGIVGGEGSEYVLRSGWSILLALGYATLFTALAALSITRRDP